MTMTNNDDTKKRISTLFLILAMLPKNMTTARMMTSHHSPFFNPPHAPRRRHRFLALLAIVAFPPAILSNGLAASKTSDPHYKSSSGATSVSFRSIFIHPTGTDSRVRSFSSTTSSSLLRRRDVSLPMSFSWEPIGSISGERFGDKSGFSSRISGNGQRLVIGARYNDGNGTDSGHARVYEDVNGTWEQVGQDLDGERAGDLSGMNVGINADGNRIIIGAPYNDGNGTDSGHARVYEYEDVNGTWKQVGQDLDGEGARDQSGFSVEMSADGNRIIIGALHNDGNGTDSGHARVYEDVNGTWEQVGQDLDGEGAGDQSGWGVGDQSGWGVGMNADGKRIIIGAPYNDGNGSNSGHARVYQDAGGTWLQVGQDLDGEKAGDQSGVDVGMSADGKRIIIGARNNDENGANSGHARVYYEDVDGTWVQVGQDLDGERAGDLAGRGVDISADGRRVIIGAPSNDNEYGENSGHARVYEDVGGTWKQVGKDLDGEEAGGWSGFSVGMSADGQKVMFGTPGSSIICKVKVFTLKQTLIPAPAVTTTSTPSEVPTASPTSSPSEVPTASPTSSPSEVPTTSPTSSPSEVPTTFPTSSPSEVPTTFPTSSPSEVPTASPTFTPSEVPTASPTSSPSEVPTAFPTSSPSEVPTASPTSRPSEVPTASPTSSPPAEVTTTSLIDITSPEDPDSGSTLIMWFTAPILLINVVLLVCICRRHRRQQLKRNDATPPAGSTIATFKNPRIQVDEELQADVITLPEEIEIIHNNDEDHPQPQQPPFRYDAFLTHNWGLDSENRDNHNRVLKFKKCLEKKLGKDSLWLDEERMTGDIINQMCDGVDDSRFVIVFVTQKYIDKVASRGPKGDRDSCLLEFNYAARKKGSSKLITVVMEEACSDPDNWDRAVGMHLGGQLFFSYMKDSELQKCAKMVYEEIQRRRREEEVE